jgi:ABC-2 type transport system ATP-binding protein
VAPGAPDEIKRREMRGEVLEIDCDQLDRALEVLQEGGGFDEVGLYGALLHVVAEGVAQRQEQIARGLRAAGVEVREMDIVEPSLEDVFISMVRHNLK